MSLSLPELIRLILLRFWGFPSVHLSYILLNFWLIPASDTTHLPAMCTFFLGISQRMCMLELWTHTGGKAVLKHLCSINAKGLQVSFVFENLHHTTLILQKSYISTCLVKIHSRTILVFKLMVIASLPYTILVYERFHRNTILSHGGRNLAMIPRGFRGLVGKFTLWNSSVVMNARMPLSTYKSSKGT